jgi:hypothetical protein
MRVDDVSCNICHAIPAGAGTEEEAGADDGSVTRLLELACGTGRFMTFVRDNYPAMEVTGLDLSPFYLQEARKNNEYWVGWCRLIARGSLHEGGRQPGASLCTRKRLSRSLSASRLTALALAGI